MDCRFAVCVVGSSDFLDWIPVLTPTFRFAWLEKGKIRLVIGINSGHQFDVGAVGIGEVPVPRITEIVIAPRPLFFARRNVVIGNMNYPCLP